MSNILFLSNRSLILPRWDISCWFQFSETIQSNFAFLVNTSHLSRIHHPCWLFLNPFAVLLPYDTVGKYRAFQEIISGSPPKIRETGKPIKSKCRFPSRIFETIFWRIHIILICCFSQATNNSPNVSGACHSLTTGIWFISIHGAIIGGDIVVSERYFPHSV